MVTVRMYLSLVGANCIQQGQAFRLQCVSLVGADCIHSGSMYTVRVKLWTGCIHSGSVYTVRVRLSF